MHSEAKKQLAPWLLLLTAIIWGLAFVAQRKAMEFSEPLTFNGLRFLLAAITLLVFAAVSDYKSLKKSNWFNPLLLVHAFLASVALFFGSTFQQVGIVYTTAGKAGFITSLYIVLVPIYDLLNGNRLSTRYWIGTGLVVSGHYLLTRDTDPYLRIGDMLVFISAVFWAMHIIVLSKVSALHQTLALAFWQFLLTGIASLILGLIFKKTDIQNLTAGWLTMLYAGIFAAGIGFTLQVAAQKYVKPEHTGLILSLEAVFAALGGYVLLQERTDTNATWGCILMLTGLLFAQFKQKIIG